MRARERYATGGPAAFGEAELVALIVGTGVGGRSTLEIAGGLLDRFGGLHGLAHAHPVELEAVDGVGPARAIRLHAALELGRRAARPLPPRGTVLTAIEAYRELGPGLDGLEVEELHAMYLDRRRKVLAVHALTRGSDGFTVVDPRQIYRPAIGLGASAVIVAHNHPSGDPTPSEMDRDVTRRVAHAGKVLGIPLLDHLVIGGGRYVSLAQQGVLPGWSDSPGFTASS